jgi:hypothetical protein
MKARASILAALVASTAYAPQAQGQGQELYKRIHGNPGCRETYYSGMVPNQFQFQGGLMIWIDVMQWRRLVEPEFRKELFEAAFRENLEYCKAKGQNAGIAVVSMSGGGKIVLNGWTSASDRSWRVTYDKVAETIAEVDAAQERRRAQETAQREREEAERKARQEREAAAADAAAKAANARRALRVEFSSKHAVEAWVSPRALMANPFPYKGKVVAVPADFLQMVSENEAIFGDLLVTGVGSTQFTVVGRPSILAVRIQGFRAVRVPLAGEVNLPSGQLVGVHFCARPGCPDVYDN